MQRRMSKPKRSKVSRRVFFGAVALSSLSCLPGAYGNSQYPSFADVVHVEHIIENVRKPVAIKRCHWEQLPDQVRYERYHPERHIRSKRVIERRAKRCRNVTEYRTQKITKGYNVTLRYQGETFTRHMMQRPGARVPVSIEIAELTAESNTDTVID